ncbi:hypothetical protein GQ457_15G018010 [Hibiscus cannabinus]
MQRVEMAPKKGDAGRTVPVETQPGEPTLENKVKRLEDSTKDATERLDVVDVRLEELEAKGDRVLEDVQGLLDETVERMDQQDESLKSEVIELKKVDEVRKACPGCAHINHAVHSATKMSPFEVVYGFNPITPLDLLPLPREQVMNKDGQSKAEYVRQLHQQERFPAQRSSKLLPRGDGPFQVVEKINENAYKLDLPGEYNVSATFNVSDLTPFDGPSDLRTNPFQEGEDDVSTSSSAHIADPEVLPQGPVTRSKAKQFREALSLSCAKLLDSFDHVYALDYVANSSNFNAAIEAFLKPSSSSSFESFFLEYAYYNSDIETI